MSGRTDHLRSLVEEASSHLRVALAQALPSDDHIIIGHIQAARNILDRSQVEQYYGEHAESHCVGTFWTEREISVIDALSKKQGLSHAAILRQALRNYQLIVEGEPDLGRKFADAIGDGDQSPLD